MDIFWSNESQEFYTIPDGDVATPKQIKEYYENRLRGNFTIPSEKS